jgi:hypothetical protein
MVLAVRALVDTQELAVLVETKKLAALLKLELTVLEAAVAAVL